MIDRVLLGYVIDFIDFTLINFAVFNVADSFVTVGAFMLIGYFLKDFIVELRSPKTEQTNESEAEPQTDNVSEEQTHDEPTNGAS